MSGSKAKTPKYNIQDSIYTQNLGVDSSLGNMSLRKNNDGSYSKVYTDSANDVLRNSLISQGLGALSLDPTAATNAYYNQATRLLEPRMDRARDRLDENLINRGIAVGNSQYSTAMGDLQDSQNSMLANIADQAIFRGQDYLGGQIGNINSLSGSRDIGLLAGMGGSNNAYDNQYQANAQRAQERAAGNQAMLKGIGDLAGAGIGALAMLSDERLKENLVKVGKLDNGLNVYVGNYRSETGLDTTPQLFLIAQEVQEIIPEAVIENKEGYLMVDYIKAVGDK
jgi:hypothetical protein